MSRASRSDTPERALRAPPSPLSVSSVSPPAPPCEGGDRTPPNPASADDECCCVCLERLQPAAVADQLPVPFPTCRRHRMHLGCLAQYRAQANSPGDLLCPLCRHGRCPDCAPSSWSGANNAALRSANSTASQCRSASPASLRRARRSVTTPSVRSRPTMPPSPAHSWGSLCCAVTMSQP